MIDRAFFALLGLAVAGCSPGSAPSATTPPVTAPATCEAVDDLVLPRGFCASVFADGLGYARHLAVRDNGDVYVAIRGEEGGLVALRDTDGDGVADRQERFAERGGTGVKLRNGYLYFAMPTRIVRYPLAAGELAPAAPPEVVVTGFIDQRSHATKTVAFDDAGGLYSNIGAPSNACQSPQRTKEAPGLDPCPELERQAGIWRFAADELGQDAYGDGQRYATGIRNAVAKAWHPAFGRLFTVQHGRDQLSELWPEIYTDEQRAELPAEEFFAVDDGDDFGWPYCMYDQRLGRKVLAPEYGGDGEAVGRCADTEDPIVAFPGHWAPNDLLFYTGRNFPSTYRNGAFVAFHGSWNRAPFPQKGFNVAFVPFRDGAPSGDYEIFADGFAGPGEIRGPRDARYRPTGLAQGPDGSLYISDSRQGRIWRVRYETPAESDAGDG